MGANMFKITCLKDGKIVNAASVFQGLLYQYKTYDEAVLAYSFLKKDSPHINFHIVPV